MPELFNTVTLLGAMQGGVLAFVLSRRRENHLASQILGALVGALALMLLFGFVERRWGFHGFPHLIALGSPLPLLFNPLLCLYVLALTRPLERFERRWLVHGLPFLAHLAYMTQGFYLRDDETVLALVRAHLAGHPTPGTRFFMALQLAQALIYLPVAYLALRGHARRMEGYYSELRAVDLRWLSVIVLMNVAVWSLVALDHLAQALSFRPAWISWLEPAVQSGSALFIFLIGYLFLWQPELVQKARAARVLDEDADLPQLPKSPALAEPASLQQPVEPVDPVEPEEHAVRAPRYQRNRLDDDEAHRLVEALERLMREDEPYRDGSLTVQGLADTLAITPHLLSQVLNVHLGRSFYNFVNEYRTRALMEALVDPKATERGVLELALDAGFSSKSTLNSFFKKHTGLTPSAYRKQKTQAVTAG